jgi:hypothetical protein
MEATMIERRGRRMNRDARPTEDSDREVKFHETTAKQDEFEELVREEGDFDEAVKDAARGKKPKKKPPTSSNM